MAVFPSLSSSISLPYVSISMSPQHSLANLLLSGLFPRILSLIPTSCFLPQLIGP